MIKNFVLVKNTTISLQAVAAKAHLAEKQYLLEQQTFITEKGLLCRKQSKANIFRKKKFRTKVNLTMERSNRAISPLTSLAIITCMYSKALSSV